MDPQEYEYSLESIRCVKESSVQFFDSREEEADNGRLGEAELLNKVEELKQLIAHPPRPGAIKGKQNSPFILITANGDHLYEESKTLRISKNVLRRCVEVGVMPPQMLVVYQMKGDHFSHRVLYDEETDTPVAIYVLLRVPRLNRLITLSMRIDLYTHTTLAVLTSVVPTTVTSLRTRCIRQSHLLARHPLHLLTFILEHRMREFEEYLERLWAVVGTLDRKAGIEPHWRIVHGRKEMNRGDDFGNLLRELHEVGTELRLVHTMSRLAVGLGGEFRKLMSRMEALRAEVGERPVKKTVRAEWEDQVAYDERRATMTAQKFEASIERVHAQINVTYSLIAQNSSEQNIQIARFAAKDGQTMKTITVLTLTFLPSTMLASLWDAGIFSLPEDKSWRVYVGATFALTVTVFALWFLYGWMVRIEQPVHVFDTRDREEEAVQAEGMEIQLGILKS